MEVDTASIQGVVVDIQAEEPSEGNHVVIHEENGHSVKDGCISEKVDTDEKLHF